MSETGKHLNVNISTGLTDGARITSNLEQEVIVTTRDKVELALRRVLPAYTNKEQVASAWTLFLGLLIALLTAEFKTFAGIPPTAWTTLFIIGALASFVWAVRELVRYLRAPDLEHVIGEIAQAGARVESLTR